MPTTLKVSDVDLNQASGGNNFGGYRLTRSEVALTAKLDRSRSPSPPDKFQLNFPAEGLFYDFQQSGFLSAVHIAYDGHLPLTLSPDDLWCVINLGFAHHVTENSESLRPHFVSHEGQKSLVVSVPFSKGDPSADWDRVLAIFQSMIAENTKPGTGDLTAHNFTTSGPVEKTVGHIHLMGAMQKYFSYGMMTSCGIPSITLLGETSDWESIRNRVESFRVYDLGWWVDALIPIVDQFVKASKGDVDLPFWESIYKQRTMSGGSTLSGHFIHLFPYISTRQGMTRNHQVGQTNPRMEAQDCPKGYSAVPFDWECGGIHHMNFYGGHLGVSVDQGSIRPVIGWAVGDRPKDR